MKLLCIPQPYQKGARREVTGTSWLALTHYDGYSLKQVLIFQWCDLWVAVVFRWCRFYAAPTSLYGSSSVTTLRSPRVVRLGQKMAASRELGVNRGPRFPSFGAAVGRGRRAGGLSTPLPAPQSGRSSPISVATAARQDDDPILHFRGRKDCRLIELAALDWQL